MVLAFTDDVLVAAVVRRCSTAAIIFNGSTQTLVTSVELLGTAGSWLFASLKRGF